VFLLVQGKEVLPDIENVAVFEHYVSPEVFILPVVTKVAQQKCMTLITGKALQLYTIAN
jgi:hypothetical protein